MINTVVTGLGSICSVGKNVDEIWNNLINGVCGIKKVESFDIKNCYSKLGAEIEGFSPSFSTKEKQFKSMDKVSLLAIESVYEALKDANLFLENEDRSKIGIVIGSCSGGVLSLQDYHRQYVENEKKCNPKDILRSNVSSIANNIALVFNTRGLTTNISNACASGTIAISYACNLIEQGILDTVIVCGTDTFAHLPFGGFHSIRALDDEKNSPFSLSKGINLGEGAGTLILESKEHAEKREAAIYCNILGHSINGDGYHITSPRLDGEGIVRVMNKALENADIKPSNIDYINAHGTGTKANDAAEKKGINRVFGEYKDKLMVSSSKASIGHCLGAAGTLESIFTIKALKEGKIPPTLNFNESIKSEIDFVPNKMKEKNITTAMSNSLAFGGNNASIIFSKNNPNNSKEKTEGNRVFITGLGIVTPMGIGKEEYLENMKKGNSAIKFQCVDEKENLKGYLSNIEIEDYEKYGLNPLKTRRLDRQAKLLSVSGFMALKDSNITITEDNEDYVGLISGTSEGATKEVIDFNEGLLKKGLEFGSPFKFPNTVYNTPAGHFSILSGIKGYTATFTNGFMSGINSVSYGYDLIKQNRQKIVVANGVDQNSKATYIGFNNVKALHNGEIPFKGAYNFEQKGFILGEGSTSIILESEENVKMRNAKCYAEVVGYGFSTMAERAGKVGTDGYGLSEAIKEAIKMSNITENEIDAVVGCGNGDSLIDTMEMNSYKTVFKENIKNIPIHTIKNLVGEGRASTSALQIAHASLMFCEDEGITTREYKSSVTVEGKNIPLTEEKNKSYDYILVTGFAFGGSYSAVVLKKA